VCFDHETCRACMASGCLWAELERGEAVCVPARGPFLVNTNVRRVVERVTACAGSPWTPTTTFSSLEGVVDMSTSHVSEETPVVSTTTTFFGGKSCQQQP